MEFAKARLPITVNSKPCTLAFDLIAMLTLEKKFEIKRGDLRQMLTKKMSEAEALELLMKLVYSMSRSSDAPPEMKDVERMTVDEIVAVRQSLLGTIVAAHDGGLGKGQASAEVKSGAAGASRGAGGQRSRKPSRSAVSRRRSSGR